MDNQDYTTAVIGGIRLFLFGFKEAPAAPFVFVTHGRGGKAEHIFDYCRDLVKAGLAAIAIEQRNHGERLLDPAANEGWSRHHAADLYANFLGTAMDISLLLDFIPARLGIPIERVGMTGISLGGHATLMAMRLDARITAGAAIIGGGDYRRLMALRAAENQCPPEQFGDYFNADLEKTVLQYDPINYPEVFADRPLLMLNGGADRLVQPECNERFARALRSHYRHPERLKLSIYPETGHETPPAMMAEAVAWLKHWLLSEKDPFAA